MRVFVSEYAVGGACAVKSTVESMRREGLAMLRAVTEDLAQSQICSVVTTLERGLSVASNVEVISVENPDQEAVVFHRLLQEVDAVLIIAPETDGVLAERCRMVRTAGVSSWNCTPEAIEICGDKLRLAEHLIQHRLSTIPTKLADLDHPPSQIDWPIVLKPQDGAGSHLTFLIRNIREWERAVREIKAAGTANHFVIQPFIQGRTLSVGVNIGFDGMTIEYTLVGEQRLSDDGRFRYLGGIIPAPDLSLNVTNAIEEMVRNTCRTIPGLAAYIGVDLLLTRDEQPLIVEINPRFTTSYIGYRKYVLTNLLKRWQMLTGPLEPIPRQGFEYGLHFDEDALPIEFEVP